MADEPAPPQMSPDGRWRWDGTRWTPLNGGPAIPPASAGGDPIKIVVLAMRIWVFFPVGIGVLMFIVTPTYWRPMVSTTLGFELLVAGVAVVAISLALTEVASRLIRRGGMGLAIGIALMIGTFFLQFITIWIILLGPALLILLTRNNSG